jgi:hypothetical protein
VNRRTLPLLPFACLALLAGCANQSVSPTDKTLIANADQLHARINRLREWAAKPSR